MILHDKVSVVVPAYNAERTISAAIDSVLGQTYSNLELVIVDDGSTDATLDIVSAFNDERIKLIRNQNNLGAGQARDVAISESLGDWIAVMDADDMWSLDRLEKLLSMEPEINYQHILVDNVVECFERNGDLVPLKTSWKKSDPIFSRGTGDLCDYLSKPHHLIKPLFPRRLVNELKLTHTPTKFGEDSEFFIRLMKLGNLKLKVYPEGLYYYRLTQGTMSSSEERHLLKKEVLERLLDVLDFSPEEQQAIQQHVRQKNTEILYAPFLMAITERQYRKILGSAIKNPRNLLLFLSRFPKSAYYRLKVFLAKGQAR